MDKYNLISCDNIGPNFRVYEGDIRATGVQVALHCIRTKDASRSLIRVLSGAQERRYLASREFFLLSDGRFPEISGKHRPKSTNQQHSDCKMMCFVEPLLHTTMADLIRGSNIPGGAIISPSDVSIVFRKLLSILSYFHENGFSYDYLIPTHVIIRGNCDVRVRFPYWFLCNCTIQSLPYQPPELLMGLPSAAFPLHCVDTWMFACCFGEVFLGYPLFQGVDFADQLLKVFKILGCPSRHELAYLAEGYDSLIFPESQDCCLELLFQESEEDRGGDSYIGSFIMFLESILTYDPFARPTVQELRTNGIIGRPRYFPSLANLRFSDQGVGRVVLVGNRNEKWWEEKPVLWNSAVSSLPRRSQDNNEYSSPEPKRNVQNEPPSLKISDLLVTSTNRPRSSLTQATPSCHDKNIQNMLSSYSSPATSSILAMLNKASSPASTENTNNPFRARTPSIQKLRDASFKVNQLGVSENKFNPSRRGIASPQKVKALAAVNFPQHGITHPSDSDITDDWNLSTSEIRDLRRTNWNSFVRRTICSEKQ